DPGAQAREDAHVTGQADTGERGTERAVRSRDHPIAGDRERGARPEGIALDGRDHRFRPAPDLLDHALRGLRPGQRLLARHPPHGGDVAAGTERAARSGAHHHTHAGVRHRGFHRVPQLDAQFEIDRVALARAVQRDHPHRPAILGQHTVGHRYFPVNRGGRRSITAARPSNASAVPDSSATVRASSGSCSSSDEPTPRHTRRLVAAMACGGRAAIVRASASASSKTDSSGTTLVSSPTSRASAAVNVGFVSRISMALRSPTSLLRVTVAPASGAIPTRTAPEKNFAPSAATTKSAAHTRPNPPPPAANPCTAAITGGLSCTSADTAICSRAVASRR